MTTVEWRVDREADAILIIDSSDQVAEVVQPDEGILKDYLSVSSSLAAWRGWDGWRTVAADGRDPESWGELIMGRADNGDVITVDPELFWERVYRWFRSRRQDYAPRSGQTGI
jgi:hypothetical protein